MAKNNTKTLLFKAAGFVGAAGLSVLISLPGLSQQSPGNTTPNVPSTTKPTNPGGRDAGTTNGGEDLNRVPSSSSTTQQNGGSMNGQMMNGQTSGTPGNADPSSNPDPINRVEGRDQGTQNQMNSSPNGSNGQRGTNQPGANQPGSMQPDGSSVQQDGSMQQGGSSMQQDGSMQQGGSMQRMQTAPQSGGQYNNSQQGMPQSDTNSGSTTDGQGTTQQQPANGSVRALW